MAFLVLIFLIKNKCNLMISRSCLKVKREEIPCHMSNGIQSTCCRVALVENVSIPAESEIIVAGKPLDKLDRGRLGIVEPSLKICTEHRHFSGESVD